MITSLAFKSLLSRWGRNLLTVGIIAVGISLVAGSFIFADSLQQTFDRVFEEMGTNTDLIVRSAGENNGERAPVPESIVDTVAAVPGVQTARGELGRPIAGFTEDDEPFTSGPPTLALTFSDSLPDQYSFDGEAPSGASEVVIDAATASRFDLGVDDTIKVATKTGAYDVKITGLVTNSTGSDGGAALVFFDMPAAAEMLDAVGVVDEVQIAVTPGEDIETVQTAVEDAVAGLVPTGLEVITGQDAADEILDFLTDFTTYMGIGLLVFALITAFVASFIINNIVTITIGQRLRELALMRAIGGSVGQVRRLLLFETGTVGVVGTLVGILGGIVIAKLYLFGFNSIGFGFPQTGSVIAFRTIVVSIIVGLGSVLVSAFLPSRRAGKVPPVAAMRPELGFQALAKSRRIVGGAILTGLGVALFLIGLFVRPGGGWGIAILAGVGALFTFVGLGSLSTTFANPVSRLLGWPIARLFGVPGQVARDNAARSPRRTARTASALTIGVAIIGAATVFASSLSADFNRVLERSIQADFFITDQTFLGLPPQVETDLEALPELGVVTSFKNLPATLDTPTTPDGAFVSFAAVDPVEFPKLVNLDISAGSFDDMGTDGIGVYAPDATAEGLKLGDTVDVEFSNGTSSTMTVRFIFEDGSLGSGWYATQAQLDAAIPSGTNSGMILAKRADGVSAEDAKKALEPIAEAFPQAQLRDQSEFRDSITGRIDQVLLTITMLLAAAIVLAFVGIAATMAMAVLERTREIGLMRAVGMTRGQLRKSIRWEAVIITTFGAVVGGVVGLGMGSAMVIALPDDIIAGVSLPILRMLLVVALAIVAALIFAIYPATKASRMNVLRAISHD